jgi:hypothetical protein
MRNFIVVLIFALFLPVPAASGPGSESYPLFRIERSKNANIVQYDLQLAPDGTLFKDEPVKVYWLRLAEQGQVKKLSWLQRVFAYGFKARPSDQPDSVDLFMTADIGQPVRVQRLDGSYRATIRIDDQLVLLEKIFVQAKDSGLATIVEYIELFGTRADDGEMISERLIPCRKMSRSFCKPGPETEGKR